MTHRLFDVVIVDLLDFSDAWHPQSELARPPHHKATTSDQQSSEVGGGGLPLSHAPRHMATQAQQLYTEAFFEDVWCILRGDAVLIMQFVG